MDTTGSFFLPPVASTIAGEVDSLIYFITFVSAFFLALITGLLIYFIIKYRRKGRPELTSGVDHSRSLEIVWTTIPVIILAILFFWGFSTYLKMNVVPKDAIEIKVTGLQWFWSIDYPNGINTQNELVVPVDKPVRLLMSSEDVIHSFFVPEFRIKMDVLPNRYTVAWFEATKKGTFHLYCAEYCGTQHSEMIGEVRVVSEYEYEQWLDENMDLGAGLTPEEYGAKLYRAKACHTCHSIDQKTDVGPTFKGIFGHEVKLADGSTAVIDENYIRESILRPQAKVVTGYQPVMPTYQGIIKDPEIDALIAFIKSLNE